jgi:arabinan endo-1,5-alpha-L-arabinosidase
MTIEKILVPEIASDWQLLYKPVETGCYVNDHSIIQAHDGTWHLFGITREGSEVKPNHERWFTHGKGTQLISDSGLQEVGIVCDNGVRAWAPSVVTDGKRYYMHYGPSPMRMATSYELSCWMEHTPVLHNAPLDSCIRDYMVLRMDDGSWLMYATGIQDRFGVISVFRSEDLINWTFLRYALRTCANAPLNPPWGATESPFVVAKDDGYYLFITYTDCQTENYHNTLVFYSKDPTDFGEYTGDNEQDVIIAHLHAHAPEIVCAEDGSWYITTCGWRNRGVPIEGAVAIARLEWKPKSTEQSVAQRRGKPRA